MMPIKKVVFDYSELRGRIKAKVGNEGDFARQIGRSPQYISQVFNCKKYFTMSDIENACTVLDIPRSDIGFFFYAH